MKFNIRKYDNVTFHIDKATNRRIKALYLWFDYEVIKHELSLKDQVRLLDKWTNRFIEEEFYEIVPFLESRRYDILKLIVKENWGNMSYINKLIILVGNLKKKVSELIFKT